MRNSPTVSNRWSPDISQHVHKFWWKPVLVFELWPVDLEQRGRGLSCSPPGLLLLLKLKDSTKIQRHTRLRLCSRTKRKATQVPSSGNIVQIMWSFLCKGTLQYISLYSHHTLSINLSYLLSCNAKNQFLLSTVSSTPAAAAAARRYDVVLCECTHLKVNDHIKLSSLIAKELKYNQCFIKKPERLYANQNLRLPLHSNLKKS